MVYTRTIILLAFIPTSLMMAGTDITDTVFNLDEVSIKSSSVANYIPGSQIQTIDSSVIEQHKSGFGYVGELLRKETIVTMNTYGPGGLSTMSVRGGGSQHSTIVWNNINLQSPMNGSFNYSTLPVEFIGGVTMQYGGSSSIYGSGTATGSLHLNNILHLNTATNGYINLNAGSGHNYLTSAGFASGHKKIATSVKLFYQDNANNFKFKNRYKRDQIERLEHGGYKQYGIALGNIIRTGQNSLLETNIWYLDFNKNIPAQMSDYAIGEAQQHDKNLLYAINYKYLKSDFQIRYSSGGFFNQILNQDPSNRIDADNHSTTLINELSLKVKPITNVSFEIHSGLKNEFAYSANYNQIRNRHIAYIFVSAQYKIIPDYLKFVTNVRQELTDGKLIPIVFSLGTKINIPGNLEFGAYISKNYSLPTFNQLYWTNDAYSTGNPDLVPESGWSYESNIKQKILGDIYNVENSVTVFLINMENWILWKSDDTNIWRPYNVQKGESKGIEYNNTLILNFGKNTIKSNIWYTYTSARILRTDNDVFNTSTQLWYVPKHKMRLRLDYKYRNYSLSYVQIAESKRTIDNAGGTLKPFTTGDIIISANYPLKKNKIALTFRVDNIWNTSYEIKEGYAMPLRQYCIGLKYLIN